MRVAEIEIDGKKYKTCFSARVMRACTERYGGVDGVENAISSNNVVGALDEAIWMLSVLMDAGARYCAMNGIDHNPALTMDELYDVVSTDDLAQLQAAVSSTIIAGKETTVEAEPPKNAKATPAKGKAK